MSKYLKSSNSEAMTRVNYPHGPCKHTLKANIVNTFRLELPEKKHFTQQHSNRNLELFWRKLTIRKLKFPSTFHVDPLKHSVAERCVKISAHSV